MQTTRWVDRKTDDLDRVISLLIDEVPDDPISESIFWRNWQLDKVSDHNIQETFNGRDIEFNIVKYTVDQVTAGLQPIEDRTVKKEGFIIVYINGSSINYITDRNSGAKRFLRKVLSYTGKNEVQENMPELDSDFFIWLISKVYKSENIIESGNDELSDIIIDAIKGFKGDTEDLLTQVSASGESVMNIISTLSFLLESSNLNQITIDLEYDDHDEVSLSLKRGVIILDPNKYCGPYDEEINTDNEIKTAKILLLVYLEILPILIQAYKSDETDELWNQEIYTDFMNEVAEDIENRIQQQIKSINNG